MLPSKHFEEVTKEKFNKVHCVFSPVNVELCFKKQKEARQI